LDPREGHDLGRAAMPLKLTTALQRLRVRFLAAARLFPQHAND
jgi:hypothetical protein